MVRACKLRLSLKRLKTCLLKNVFLLSAQLPGVRGRLPLHMFRASCFLPGLAWRLCILLSVCAQVMRMQRPEQDAGVVYHSLPYWADMGSLTETVGCISAQLAGPNFWGLPISAPES